MNITTRPLVEEHKAEDTSETLDYSRLPAEPEEESREPEYSISRTALAISFPLLAAAIVAGGMFTALGARFQGAIAALLGVGAAILVRRVRRLTLMNIALIASLFGIGVLMVIPSGIGNVFDLTTNVVSAATSGDVLRPPVDYEPGWRAILGWLMAGLGFASAWSAIEVRRPARGVLIPLIMVGIGAISVPKDQQLLTGIAAFVLFAVGLSLLSGIERTEDRIPLSFELRRFARGVAQVGAAVVVLLLLARSNLLFPPPVYDPTQEAQKPRAVPLSEVPDRVLFTVKSTITGPWRMGVLDVYDGNDWRLPPFAKTRLEEVPASGVIDRQLTPGFRATFEMRGLTGAVLPGLPNTVGLVSKGLDVVYDHRTGNIRTGQGQISPGNTYSVAAARLPSVEELQRVDKEPPKSTESYLQIPPPPSAISDLMRKAPTTSKWDRLDFLRQHLLRTVVASGQGTPVSITPDRVQEMLTSKKEATPFEIVAAEAMLARWSGVPSRIGYGFDGGEAAEANTYEVRPKHGATFLEVYFEGYGWLPIIGAPKKARVTLTETEQQTSPNSLPSEDISVDLIIPLLREPPSVLLQQIRQTVLALVAVILVLGLVFYLYPLAAKARKRARLRALAHKQGPPARIAVAYAEWRDSTTDLGYRFPSDTPLMFLDRVMDDEEHIALAWLVTRSLWGDLTSDVTDEDADFAEGLSRSLVKRASQAHPYTLRVVSALSRLSLKHPYAERVPRIEEQRRFRRPSKKEERVRVAS